MYCKCRDVSVLVNVEFKMGNQCGISKKEIEC